MSNIPRRESIIVEFFHGGPTSPYWSTFWPRGELRTFKDQEAVRLFCRNKGIVPAFTTPGATHE